MQGSYVELLTLLALGFLAAMPVIVPARRRQLSRRLTQLMGILVFIFIVYTCMGVFGMVRNLFRGLAEIGRENIIALYFCSVPVMILATSLIFGPMFCGWICPTGALQEFVGLLVKPWHARRRAQGWKFSWVALACSLLTAALFFLWLWRLSQTRVFFIEDSSIYWAEVLLILQFALLWRMRQWDRPLAAAAARLAGDHRGGRDRGLVGHVAGAPGLHQGLRPGLVALHGDRAAWRRWSCPRPGAGISVPGARPSAGRPGSVPRRLESVPGRCARVRHVRDGVRRGRHPARRGGNPRVPSMSALRRSLPLRGDPTQGTVAGGGQSMAGAKSLPSPSGRGAGGEGQC